MKPLSFQWRSLDTHPDRPHGYATFTLPTGRQVELEFPSFASAETFFKSLQYEFGHVRYDARASLLAEISRIAP